jgi:hypothetical protein
VNAILEEAYFTWLYKQVGVLSAKNPSRTHWSLAKQLYAKEFVWFIPNDDNRLEDGRDLRFEFLVEQELEDPGPEWMGLGCSMFEMLIGLARRLAFDADGEPREWFWQMLDNLDIAHYTDDRYTKRIFAEVEEALDRVIWRQYAPDGHGGLFPLSDAHEDQRKVELWYQASAYLSTEI